MVLPLFALHLINMIAIVLHAPPDLLPLQGHNRVVVAFAESERDSELQQQLQRLENEEAGVAERDLRVFAVLGHSALIDRLRNSLHCPAQGFAVALIGKDGGVKLHKTHPVTAEELFGTIDRMPMRRDEMRRNH